jgi:Family of unknown function (DUF6011)
MSTITTAQAGYIAKLNQQLADLGATPRAALAATATIAEASRAIEELKELVAQARSASRPQLVSEGVYRRSADGVMFRVQLSQEGRHYAKTLLASGGWGYEKGAIYTLKGSERLTLAQLEEWGISTGVCAICSRLLSTAESVARGIGPVCASRY